MGEKNKFVMSVAQERTDSCQYEFFLSFIKQLKIAFSGGKQKKGFSLEKAPIHTCLGREAEGKVLFLTPMPSGLAVSGLSLCMYLSSNLSFLSSFKF